MRKILISLVIFFYIFSSLLFISTYSIEEVSDFVYSKKDGSYNLELKSELESDQIIKNLKEVADKYNVNISLISFFPEGYGKEKIKLFTYIKDEPKFYENIFIKHGLKLNENFDSGSFISSEVTNKKFQAGQIGLMGLGPYTLEIWKLDDALQENFNSTYMVQADNIDVMKQIQEDLKAKNITVKSVKYANEFFMDFRMIVILACFLVFIVLTIIYNVVMSAKDIAIKKLNGYSDTKVMFKYFLSIFIPIFTIAIISLVITSGYIIYCYNNFNMFALEKNFLYILISTAILTLFCFVSCFFVKIIDIAYAIKNKKPIAQLQFLNYCSKFIFASIIIVVSIITLVRLGDLQSRKQDLSVWDTVKNYAYLTLSGSNNKNGDSNIAYRKLFDELDKKGLLLVNPNVYYSISKEAYERISNTPQGANPDYVDQSMQLNARYFNMCDIVDLNGNKVVLTEEATDSATIIIPEKYLPRKDIVEKSYISFYHYSLDQKVPENEIRQKINFIYVKDNQKYFSFNPEASIATNNYIVDPIINIVNSKNQSINQYEALASHSAMFFKVNDVENPYQEILPLLKELKLDKYIKYTPLVYSKISNVISRINMEINSNMTIVFICLVIYLTILCYTVINYLEKTKVDNAIKYIHGYGFMNRYLKFMLFMVLPTILIGLIIGSLLNSMSLALLVISTLILLEVFVIITILNLKELSNVRNILKGQ